eukprot:scpid61232/ scgid30807/ 
MLVAGSCLIVVEESALLPVLDDGQCTVCSVCPSLTVHGMALSPASSTSKLLSCASMAKTIECICRCAFSKSSSRRKSSADSMAQRNQSLLQLWCKAARPRAVLLRQSEQKLIH